MKLQCLGLDTDTRPLPLPTTRYDSTKIRLSATIWQPLVQSLALGMYLQPAIGNTVRDGLIRRNNFTLRMW